MTSSRRTFQELALLYRKQRSASVESATNMTLLVIRREDFMEIFVRTADGKEPEHITFLRYGGDVPQVIMSSQETEHVTFLRYGGDAP